MILGTNALSAFSKGDPAVKEALRSSRNHSLPTIVLGEFRFGLERSRLRSELQHWLAGLENDMEVLDVSRDTSHFYAKVKDNLRTMGRPIPENYIWIAALALQHGLSVLTRDAHFRLIRGLACVSW